MQSNFIDEVFMSTILIRNATVLTFTSETPVLKNHAVLIEGKK